MTRESVNKEETIRAVVAAAGAYQKKELPREEAVQAALQGLKILLFPEYKGIGYFGETNGTSLHDLALITYERLCGQLVKAFKYSGEDEPASRSEQTANYMFHKLPFIRKALDLDVKAAFEGDPAASGMDEIMVYPGFHAITAHRIAHELYGMGVPLIPRMINEYAHSKTGIDIHPGAKIGKRFFIDHGTGTVIGETAEIGENVRIYQGVTLGALSLEDVDSLRGEKRHPTIEDDVIIYANATILGGKTVIGKGSIIGGGVWLTGSVPPRTTVTQGKPNLKYKQDVGV